MLSCTKKKLKSLLRLVSVKHCARYAELVSLFFNGTVVTTDTPRRFFGANSFYTTAANRMSRCIFTNAVTAQDVVTLYQINRGQKQ